MRHPRGLIDMTGMKFGHLTVIEYAGSSNDTAVRFALHYLKELNPRYAVWLQTDRHRIELLDDSQPISYNIIASDTYNPCANDHFIKTWFTSDSNQQLNLQKNTLAFEQLCQQLDIKSIVLPRDNTMDRPFPNGGARDLLHPGADTYKKLAQHIAGLVIA